MFHLALTSVTAAVGFFFIIEIHFLPIPLSARRACLIPCRSRALPAARTHPGGFCCRLVFFVIRCAIIRLAARLNILAIRELACEASPNTVRIAFPRHLYSHHHDTIISPQAAARTTAQPVSVKYGSLIPSPPYANSNHVNRGSCFHGTGFGSSVVPSTRSRTATPLSVL